MNVSGQLKGTYSRKQKPSTFNVNTGKLLKAARKANGYSQTYVAESIGKFKQYEISRIEAGYSRLFADDLVLFSRLYNRPVSYFYNHGTLEN
jgi:transcriptional regulator with XRE-family HTH domain